MTVPNPDKAALAAARKEAAAKRRAAPVKKKAAAKRAPAKKKAAPRKRNKKFPVGEQEKDHDISLHLPMHFFGKRAQVEKAVNGMLELLRVKGYVVGDNWTMIFDADEWVPPPVTKRKPKTAPALGSP